MKRLILAGLVLLIACAPAAGQRTARIKWDQIEPVATLASVDAATAEFSGHVEAPSVGRLTGGHLTFPAGQGVRILDAGGSAAGLTVSPPTRLGSTLRVAGDIWVATGAAPTGNPSVWFTDTQRLKFEKPNDRFHFDDSLYVFGYGEFDGLLATWGDWLDFRRLSSGTMGLRFYPDWVGAPGTFHSFAHNGTLFNVSDSLNVQGNTSSQGNVLAYANVNIDYDESSNTPRLVFGQSGTEYLEYNRSQDRFTFSGDVAIAGTLIYTATDLLGDNLDLAGWLNVDGTATVGGVLQSNALRSNTLSGEMGDGGRIELFDNDGHNQNDGLVFWDDSAPTARLSAERGLRITSDTAGLTVDGTAAVAGDMSVGGTLAPRNIEGATGVLYVNGPLAIGAGTSGTTDDILWFGKPDGGVKRLQYLINTFVLFDKLEILGALTADSLTLDNGDLVMKSEGDIRFSDQRDSYIHENSVYNIELYVEGQEVIEAASSVLYVRKPIQSTGPIIAPAIGHSALGGTIFFHEQDTSTSDGILLVDDNITLVRVNREYGTVVDATLTVGGHATIADASVTGNLTVGDRLTLAGTGLLSANLITSVSGEVGGNIGYWNSSTGGAGSSFGNETVDGLTFRDDSNPLGNWSLETGLVVGNSGPGLRVHNATLLSGTLAVGATATFEGDVEVAGEVRMASKAWGRLLTPADLVAATPTGGGAGIVLNALAGSNSGADFAADGEAAISLHVPFDVAGGDVYLDSVIIYYITTHSSAYIDNCDLRLFTRSGVTIATNIIVADTTNHGSGATGQGAIQLLTGGDLNMNDGGLQLDITAAGTGSGVVRLAGIWLQGHTQ